MFTEGMMAPETIFKRLQTKHSYKVRLSVENEDLGKNEERPNLSNWRANAVAINC